MIDYIINLNNNNNNCNNLFQSSSIIINFNFKNSNYKLYFFIDMIKIIIFYCKYLKKIITYTYYNINNNLLLLKKPICYFNSNCIDIQLLFFFILSSSNNVK